MLLEILPHTYLVCLTSQSQLDLYLFSAFHYMVDACPLGDCHGAQHKRHVKFIKLIKVTWQVNQLHLDITVSKGVIASRNCPLQSLLSQQSFL